ncbi:MAG: hypothetical protein KI790_21140 [Cyclobacteriaceae bacterium]|nr:hypothetical protein [Cyclobacteriaceae bacterium HetDA_MAG_MS6]
MINLLAVLAFSIHPFHVSVCEMEYDKTDKNLKISVRIFADDLEATLQQFGKNDTLDVLNEADWMLTNQLLKQYVYQGLEMEVKGKALIFNYLGAEIEEDAIWCYLEITKQKPFKSITIRNTLLMEMFEDQENLIHFKKEGVVRSARLSRSTNSTMLTWSQ